MSVVSIALTNSVAKALESSFLEYGMSIVTHISQELNLEVEVAQRFEEYVKAQTVSFTKKGSSKSSVGEKKSSKTAKSKVKADGPSIPLPFVGEIREDLCMGIALNHGLHTQCWKYPIEGSEYCKTCTNAANKNGKPTYGNIRDRLDCDLLEYVDPKGKKTLPYANIVKKMNLNQEVIDAECEKWGVVIPEEHMVYRKTNKGGRPKKSDSDSENSSVSNGEKPDLVLNAMAENTSTLDTAMDVAEEACAIAEKEIAKLMEEQENDVNPFEVAHDDAEAAETQSVVSAASGDNPFEEAKPKTKKVVKKTKKESWASKGKKVNMVNYFPDWKNQFKAMKNESVEDLAKARYCATQKMNDIEDQESIPSYQLLINYMTSLILKKNDGEDYEYTPEEEQTDIEEIEDLEEIDDEDF